MTRRRMQAMLRGAGSILDIYPDPDPDRYLRLVPARPVGSTEERLGDIWRRVGKRISDAAERVHHESESESESSAHPEEAASPAHGGERRPS